MVFRWPPLNEVFNSQNDTLSLILPMVNERDCLSNRNFKFNQLKWLVANFRSLSSMQDELDDAVEVYCPQASLCSDIRFLSNKSNRQYSIQSKLTIHWTDRFCPRKVAYMWQWKKCFSLEVVNLLVDNIICFVRVKFEFSYIMAGLSYRHPDPDVMFIQELYTVLNFVKQRYPQCPIILRGNFNYPGFDEIDCVW